MTTQSQTLPPRLPDEPFKEWCERRGFSVWKGYQMIREGTAPRTIKIGRKRTVPPAADAEWEAKYCVESTIDEGDAATSRQNRRGG